MDSVSIGSGAYDSAADAALFIEFAGVCPGTAVGGRMVSVALSTMAKTDLAPLCLTNSPGWTGGTGGWIPPELPQRVYWGWDNANRSGYVIARSGAQVAGGTHRRGLPSTSTRAPRTRGRGSRPTNPGGPGLMKDYNIRAVWDSVNSRLL